MKIYLKNTFVVILFGFLVACSGTTDLRDNKSQQAAYIHTTAMNLLGWGHLGRESVRGEIIRADNKLLGSGFRYTEVAMTPGIHEIEMRWVSTQKPPNSNNFNITDSSLSVGLIVVNSREYSSSKTFVTKVNLENGYHYFVNLEPSITNKTSFKLPSRLCLSKAKLGTGKVKKAPAGNILIHSKLPAIACSSK